VADNKGIKQQQQGDKTTTTRGQTTTTRGQTKVGLFLVWTKKTEMFMVLELLCFQQKAKKHN